MKISFLLQTLISVVLLASQCSFGALAAQLFINDEETSVMTAGAPANLKIDFFNTESSDPLHHFHPMHEKEVHLILVSEDLDSFSHLHPMKLSEHLGIFGVDLNLPTTDPYNLDSSSAVMKAGGYFVFAESMPMGFSMTTIPLSLTASGSRDQNKPLMLDLKSPDGFIYKTFEDYVVKLKVKTYPHCGTFSALLEMDLQKKDPVTQTLVDVTDIEPWLNSFAHTVMVSEQGTTATEKHFIHLHAVWPLVDDPETERGPYIRMASDSHVPMREGIYKIWFQFKHQGKVHTIPFVIDIKAPVIPPGIEAFC